VTAEERDSTDEDIEELAGDEAISVSYAVRLIDVSRVYDLGTRKIAALQNVNLSVKAGEFVVVHGPSGSGKTTLLNLIGAIDAATSGRVLLMDVPINDYDESFKATFRLTNTGFIFQSYNLVSTLTAAENVMFPMQLAEQPIEKTREEASRLLAKVGIADREDHLPWQLSSGEQQRVAFARAMANDPPIILADEPTANLDSESAGLIRRLLDELSGRGKTIIVMTHDEKIIGRLGSTLYTMKGGAVEAIV